MPRPRPLAGDLIARAAAALPPAPLPPRERTSGLDPQTVAEFLAYDIPFETEPAYGLAPLAHEEHRRG